MSLKDKIRSELTSAMRTQDKLRLSTLRGMIAAIETREKSGKTPEQLSDAQIVSVLNKEVSKRKDTADIFQKASRSDKAEQELAEAVIISEFLPAQLSAKEIEATVDHIIETLNASSMKDMGGVMKAVTAELGGKANSKDISIIVRDKLSD